MKSGNYARLRLSISSGSKGGIIYGSYNHPLNTTQGTCRITKAGITITSTWTLFVQNKVPGKEGGMWKQSRNVLASSFGADIPQTVVQFVEPPKELFQPRLVRPVKVI